MLKCRNPTATWAWPVATMMNAAKTCAILRMSLLSDLEWPDDPANGGALRYQLFANGRTGSPVGGPLL
jgi:hypothetical protein